MYSTSKLKILLFILSLIQIIFWIDNISLMLSIFTTQALLILTINKKYFYTIMLILSFSVLIYATLNIETSILSILRITSSYIVYTLIIIMINLLKEEKQYWIDLSKLIPKIFFTISTIILFSVSIILLSASTLSIQPSYIDTIILIILIAIILALLASQT